MSQTSHYRHNHYVPEWYQKRFMESGRNKYYYLDLCPDVVRNGAHKFTRRELLFWGSRKCFAKNDLYTTNYGSIENTDIEKFFFGIIDNDGLDAVEYFSNFEHPNWEPKQFEALVPYMSVQKLRTPKGLGWLQKISKETDRSLNLIFLQRVQNIFCAVWTECVWQIASAVESPTKFIISDHPVTVYNRACFPISDFCKGFNDPDIRMVGTHTYFPLSIDKILILTNLSWVRNPYQSEKTLRPNRDYFRNTIFNFQQIQTHRELSEEEVLQINYITKRRAFRYIAGADKEWLYPERRLRHDHWRKLGRGLLLMPEPRDVFMGGEVVIGYRGGGSDAFSEYGHRPWQRGFKDEKRYEVESAALERFKAEFAVMQGPVWRGTSAQFNQKIPHTDSEEYHQHFVESYREQREQMKKGPRYR